MMPQILQLLVLLPLIGAGLVLAVARWGGDWVRRMALTNVLITFVLSLFLAAGYRIPGELQTVTDADGTTTVKRETFPLIQFRRDLYWLATSERRLAEETLEHLRAEQRDLQTPTPGRTEADRQLLLTEVQERIAGLEASIAELTVRDQVVGPDIRLSLGVDGISLGLIVLTTLLMIPAVLVSWEAIQDRAATYYALMLLLQCGMIGVFAALDIILFYIFFEFTLIPLFFMIGLWGGNDRRWAARKFFIYTLAGSVLAFLGLLFIVLSHAWMAKTLTGHDVNLTFSIPQLVYDIPRFVSSSLKDGAPHPEVAHFWLKTGPWVFLALFCGFAIKVPLFPFHTWLPLAHVEAPTAGSVLLAGVLLKIGSYGFLRFMLPLVPDACWYFLDFVAILAVIGIIYGALLALAQDDIKKLVAYSSVSHMGFCLLGLFALNSVGICGGLLQMINHGLSTGALFTLVGMLYERYHTRDIEAFGGLTRKFPVMAFFFVLISLSSIGLPGLNGFTGEVLSLAGMFHTAPVYAILGLSGIILGAWYMLDLVRRTFYGKLREPLEHGHAQPLVIGVSGPGTAAPAHGHSAGHGHVAAPAHGAAHGDQAHGGHGHGLAEEEHVGSHHRDLNFREIAALVPLAAAIFWIGLYPQFLLDRMQPSVNEVVRVLDEARARRDASQATAADPLRTDSPVSALAKD